MKHSINLHLYFEGLFFDSFFFLSFFRARRFSGKWQLGHAIKEKLQSDRSERWDQPKPQDHWRHRWLRRWSRQDVLRKSDQVTNRRLLFSAGKWTQKHGNSFEKNFAQQITTVSYNSFFKIGFFLSLTGFWCFHTFLFLFFVLFHIRTKKPRRPTPTSKPYPRPLVLWHEFRLLKRGQRIHARLQRHHGHWRLRTVRSQGPQFQGNAVQATYDCQPSKEAKTRGKLCCPSYFVYTLCTSSNVPIVTLCTVSFVSVFPEKLQAM